MDEDQPATGDLIALRTEGEGPPIVCLPSSVGRAASYLALARALRQPAYAFEAPGLDGSEAPFTEAAALVRRYADALQEALPAGPVILLGHSSGGPLAHALAERLHAQGRAVPLVVVIDTPAAADPSPLPDDAVLLDNHLHLLRLLLGEADATPVTDRRAAARSLWTQAGLPGDPQIDAALAVERGLLTARQTQSLGRIAGDLLLIRAGEEGAPDDWGWRPHVGGRLNVVALEGDHHTLMTPPRVDALATLVAHAAAHATLTNEESADRV
jgi:thioesterase domain-containing protein